MKTSKSVENVDTGIGSDGLVEGHDGNPTRELTGPTEVEVIEIDFSGDAGFLVLNSAAEDIVADGLGADKLWDSDPDGTGDGDKELFVIDETAAAEIIGDFEVDYDEIDLSAILTLPVVADLDGASSSANVYYSTTDGELMVEVRGNTNISGDDVAKFGSGLNNETIKILFEDDDAGTSTDFV